MCTPGIMSFFQNMGGTNYDQGGVSKASTLGTPSGAPGAGFTPAPDDGGTPWAPAAAGRPMAGGGAPRPGGGGAGAPRPGAAVPPRFGAASPANPRDSERMGTAGGAQALPRLSDGLPMGASPTPLNMGLLGGGGGSYPLSSLTEIVAARPAVPLPPDMRNTTNRVRSAYGMKLQPQQGPLASGMSMPEMLVGPDQSVTSLPDLVANGLPRWS